MKRWHVLLLLGCLACSSRGVSVGSEEPCTPDPRLVAAAARSPGVQAPLCAQIGDNLLQNASFEAPPVMDCGNVNFCQVAAADVTGWSTTGDRQVIELWADGYYDVPAADGAQLAELDAATQDTLFQDLTLVPGQLVYWSVAHRGRLGLESIDVLLGPPDSPVSQSVLTSDKGAWSTYHGLYRVGAKETTTRFALDSRSGTDEGNLVDAAFVGVVE